VVRCGVVRYSKISAPIADRNRDASFVPEADSCTAAKMHLLDHLVGWLHERNDIGETVRKIAKRFGVDPGTVQRISSPLSIAAA
jgi:hypothetical protein